MGVFSGPSLGKQMACVKWKRVALPRLLEYRRRISNLGSVQKEKREEFYLLGKKNAAYFRACLTFHPPKCSRQVLLVLSCRLLLLRGLLSVVTVVKGSGASQGTTIPGYILEDQLCQQPPSAFRSRCMGSRGWKWCQRSKDPAAQSARSLAHSAHTSTPLKCPRKY